VEAAHEVREEVGSVVRSAWSRPAVSASPATALWEAALTILFFAWARTNDYGRSRQRGVLSCVCRAHVLPTLTKSHFFLFSRSLLLYRYRSCMAATTSSSSRCDGSRELCCIACKWKTPSLVARSQLAGDPHTSQELGMAHTATAGCCRQCPCVRYMCGRASTFCHRVIPFWVPLRKFPL
jgi:hypothetical protein